MEIFWYRVYATQNFKKTLNLIGYVGTKTKEILNELIEKNLIARVGQGRSTYYKLSKS